MKRSSSTEPLQKIANRPMGQIRVVGIYQGAVFWKGSEGKRCFEKIRKEALAGPAIAGAHGGKSSDCAKSWVVMQSTEGNSEGSNRGSDDHPNQERPKAL